MTREELLLKGDDWNLACDQALLNRLCDFSENLVKSSRELQNDCDSLSNNINTLSFKVTNVTNEFLMLGNSQFVENCVQEFEEFDVPSSTNDNSSSEPPAPLTKSEKEAALIEKMKQAIQIGVRIQQERADLKSADLEESIAESTSSRFSASVNIPHLIGSSKFFSSKYCGLKNENRFNPNYETLSSSAKSSSSTTSSLNKIDADVNLNDDQNQYLKQPENGNQTPSPNLYDDFVYPVDRTLPDFSPNNDDELNSSKQKTSQAKREKQKEFNSHANPKPPYLIDTRISQPQFFPVQTKPPSTPSASSSSSSSMFDDNSVSNNPDFNSRGIFPPTQTISSQPQQKQIQQINQPETEEEEEPEFRSPHFLDMSGSESDDDIFKSSFKSKSRNQNLIDEPDDIFKSDISSSNTNNNTNTVNNPSATPVVNTSEVIPKTTHQSLMEELQARSKNKTVEAKDKPEEKEEPKPTSAPKYKQQEQKNKENEPKETKSQVNSAPSKINNNVSKISSSIKVLPSSPAPTTTKNTKVSNESNETNSPLPTKTTKALTTTTKTPEKSKISNPSSQPEKKATIISQVVSSPVKNTQPQSKISQQQQQATKTKPEVKATTTKVRKSIFDNSDSDSDDLFSTKSAKKSSSAFKDKTSSANDLFSDVIPSSSSQQRQPPFLPQPKAVLKSDSDDEDDFFKSLASNQRKSEIKNVSSSIKPIEKEKEISASSSSQQSQKQIKPENINPEKVVPRVSTLTKAKVLSATTKKSIFDSSDSDSDDLFSTKNTKSLPTTSTKKDVFKSSARSKGLFSDDDNDDDDLNKKSQVVPEKAESDSDGVIFKSKENSKKDEPKSKPQSAQQSLIDQLKARNKQQNLISDEKPETKDPEPVQEKSKPMEPEILFKPVESTTTSKIESTTTKTASVPSISTTLLTKNDEIENENVVKEVENKQVSVSVSSSSSSESDLFAEIRNSKPSISTPAVDIFSAPLPPSDKTSEISEKPNKSEVNSKPIKVQEKEDSDKLFSHVPPPPKLSQKPAKTKIANSIFDSSDSDDDDLFGASSGKIKPPSFQAAASKSDEMFLQPDLRPPPILDLSDSDDDDDLFKVIDDSKINALSFASSKPSSSSFSSDKISVVAGSPLKKENEGRVESEDDDPILAIDALSLSFDDILFPKNVLHCVTKNRPKITHSRRPKTSRRHFNQSESKVSTQELDPFA